MNVKVVKDNWEEEFDKRFSYLYNNDYSQGADELLGIDFEECTEEVKNFIRELIQ